MSQIVLSGSSGTGTTGKYARCFANIDNSQGTDITYNQSSVDGDSFTINTDGIYALSYTDIDQYGDTVCITLNSDQTQDINSVTRTNRLCTMSLDPGHLQNGAVTIALSNGDVIRAQRCNPYPMDIDFVHFVIVKVG